MPEVRIPVCLCSSGFRSRETNFSDKEKDEASPSACLPAELVECLHSPFCWSRKAICFWLPLVSH